MENTILTINNLDLDEEERGLHFLQNTLQLKDKPYVYEGEFFRVAQGQLIKIAYAMPDSVIEVEDGARLDLFMASDKVTIKLKGSYSFVKIERVTRNCNGIRILGKNGELLSGGPNLELGEDVLEKLKS